MTRAIRTADEQDALTSDRRYLIWRPGEVKAIKRRANRRERREATAEINDQRETTTGPEGEK